MQTVVPSSSASIQPLHKPLTAFQERTLLALDDADFGSTHVLDSPDSIRVGTWRVLLFAVGMLGMAAGVTLIFFLTALGSVLFAMGGITCVMAYEKKSLGEDDVQDLGPSTPNAIRRHNADPSLN